jgi:transketolase
MPCQELFDRQSNSYKNKIINETKMKISLEAASTDCWKKYVGEHGLSFGINEFGKSAPYKEIYKHFGLTSANITSKSKKMMRKKI